MLSSPQILLLHVNWQVSYTCFICMHVAVHAVVILVCLLQVHSGTRSPAVSDDGALQLQQHSGDVFSR